MTYLNARPRQARWVTAEKLADDQLRLTNNQDQSVIDVNQSTQSIWALCDGTQTTQQIADYFQSHYPDHETIADDVLDAINSLSQKNLLVFDGGESALEYQGDVIRLLSPTERMLTEMESIRQLLFTELKILDSEQVDSNMEHLLGPAALANAMVLDADSARSVQDSKVISYHRAMELPAIASSVKIIINELSQQLPEVQSDIEISGNAIYLRGSHMGWHSNHSRSDGRIYCTWAEQNERNFFRYQHPLTGETITEWEPQGWNIKSFTIPPKPYRFWHCIGAQALRFSLGFRYNLPESEPKH